MASKVKGIPDGASIIETNVVEDKLLELKPTAGRLRLSFEPWQVRTLLVQS